MKKICQLNKINNTLIKTRDCISEASRELKISRRYISNCCQNKPNFKSAGGYKWMYLEGYEK